MSTNNEATDTEALEKIAHTLPKGMKSLAYDMSQLVDKNFWHLV